MSDQSADRRTLLKIDGDASGAQQAAKDVKQAVDDLGGVNEKSAKRTVESADNASAAIKNQSDAVKSGTQSFGDFAESMGTSEQQANAFKESLSRLSPEMAALAELAMKGGDALNFMLSPLGLKAVGGIGVVAALAAAIHTVLGEAKQANEEFQKAVELNRQLKESQRDVTEQVADVMATAGISSDAAVNKARAVENRFRGEGFGQEAIRAVLAFAINEAGEQTIPDEEFRRLAAQEEYTPGTLTFEDPREMTAALESARRRIEANREVIESQLQAVQARRRREDVAIRQQDRDAIARRLAEFPDAVPGDQMQQVVDDIIAMVNTGRISDPGDDVDFYSPSDYAIFSRRQGQAAQRAHSLGLISPERMRELAEKGLLSAAREEAVESLHELFVKDNPLVNLGRWLGERARETGEVFQKHLPASPPSPVSSVPPVSDWPDPLSDADEAAAMGRVQIVNHGNLFLGRDTRTARAPSRILDL